MVKRSSKIALGGLFLAGLGYVAGILTAPKSGKETRQDIQRTVSQAKSQAEKRLKALHAELGALLTQGTRRAKTMSAKAKQDLKKATDAAQQARDMVKNVLSAIHEGESEDADLDRAIKDATKAANNLKRYLKKHAEAKKA